MSSVHIVERVVVNGRTRMECSCYPWKLESARTDKSVRYEKKPWVNPFSGKK